MLYPMSSEPSREQQHRLQPPSQWDKISREEWWQIAGDRKMMATLVRERYGMSEVDAEKQVDAYFSGDSAKAGEEV